MSIPRNYADTVLSQSEVRKSVARTIRKHRNDIHEAAVVEEIVNKISKLIDINQINIKIDLLIRIFIYGGDQKVSILIDDTDGPCSGITNLQNYAEALVKEREEIYKKYSNNKTGK